MYGYGQIYGLVFIHTIAKIEIAIYTLTTDMLCLWFWLKSSFKSHTSFSDSFTSILVVVVAATAPVTSTSGKAAFSFYIRFSTASSSVSEYNLKLVVFFSDSMLVVAPYAFLFVFVAECLQKLVVENLQRPNRRIIC